MKLIIFLVKFAVVGFGGQMILKKQISPKVPQLDAKVIYLVIQGLGDSKPHGAVSATLTALLVGGVSTCSTSVPL